MTPVNVPSGDTKALNAFVFDVAAAGSLAMIPNRRTSPGGNPSLVGTSLPNVSTSVIGYLAPVAAAASAAPFAPCPTPPTPANASAPEMTFLRVFIFFSLDPLMTQTDVRNKRKLLGSSGTLTAASRVA